MFILIIFVIKNNTIMFYLLKFSQTNANVLKKDNTNHNMFHKYIIL